VDGELCVDETQSSIKHDEELPDTEKKSFVLRKRKSLDAPSDETDTEHQQPSQNCKKYVLDETSPSLNEAQPGSQVSVDSDDFPFLCAHCPAKFRQWASLRFHNARKHPNARTRSSAQQPKPSSLPLKAKPSSALQTKPSLQLPLSSKPAKSKLLSNSDPEHSEKRKHGKLCQNEKVSSLETDAKVEQSHIPNSKKTLTSDEQISSQPSPLNHEAEQDEFPFVCEHCPSKFKQFASFRFHNMRRHPNTKLSCSALQRKHSAQKPASPNTSTEPDPASNHSCPSTSSSGSDPLVETFSVPEKQCVQKYFGLGSVLKSKSSSFHAKLSVQNSLLNVESGSAKPRVYSSLVTKTAARKAGVNHEGSCLPEKEFACSKCPKSYDRKASLVNHVKVVHQTKRPYKCEVCDAAFKASNHLRRHRMIHSGVKPYRCEICPDRFFMQKSNLQIHMLTHNKDSKVAQLLHECDWGSNTFQCKLCPHRVFSQKGNLRTHIILVHGKETEGAADVCARVSTEKVAGVWSSVSATVPRVGDDGEEMRGGRTDLDTQHLQQTDIVFY
jgi:hypothetical protein